MFPPLSSRLTSHGFSHNTLLLYPFLSSLPSFSLIFPYLFLLFSYSLSSLSSIMPHHLLCGVTSFVTRSSNRSVHGVGVSRVCDVHVLFSATRKRRFRESVFRAHSSGCIAHSLLMCRNLLSSAVELSLRHVQNRSFSTHSDSSKPPSPSLPPSLSFSHPPSQSQGTPRKRNGLVYGVGLNDADYCIIIDGKHCPIYRK